MARIHYEREQPEHRKKFGPQERRKELTKRLQLINEQKEEIKKAKLEIYNKSGSEYSFKYYSVHKGKDGVYKIETNSLAELNRNKIYVMHEISRANKQLNKYIARPKSLHVRFEDCNDSYNRNSCDESRDEYSRDFEQVDFSKNEDIRKEYIQYIKKLCDALKEIEIEISSHRKKQKLR